MVLCRKDIASAHLTWRLMQRSCRVVKRADRLRGTQVCHLRKMKRVMLIDIIEAACYYLVKVYVRSHEHGANRKIAKCIQMAIHPSQLLPARLWPLIPDISFDHIPDRDLSCMGSAWWFFIRMNELLIVSIPHSHSHSRSQPVLQQVWGSEVPCIKWYMAIALSARSTRPK